MTKTITIRNDTVLASAITATGLIEPNNTEVFVDTAHKEKQLRYNCKSSSAAKQLLKKVNKDWLAAINS